MTEILAPTHGVSRRGCFFYRKPRDILKCMEYKPTIGLEIHVELKTRTKMFCDSLNGPDEKEPNKNICPICMGHPGTLPVINRNAVEHVLKVGIALDSKISEHSKFDRKNYFYPDLPKGYQISQYDEPLCLGGSLEIDEKKVRVRRVHLEEDTGRLIHPQGTDYSLVDFNRAGVPLMELVTEPDISSGKEARAFAQELQLLLRYLGISDADMEKGQLRVEANVSVSKQRTEGSEQLGTKAEVKNLNSFRSVEEAIDYEIKRQTELLEKGEKIVHETRGWDENKKQSFSQRWKEEAQDYRYFPEPDLPPLRIGVKPEGEGVFFDLEAIQKTLPELPKERVKRFVRDYGLTAEEAKLLVGEPDYAVFFEKSASEISEEDKVRGGIKYLYNYLVSDIKGLLLEKGKNLPEVKIQPEHLAKIASLLKQDKISSRVAKDLISKIIESGEDPEKLIQEGGLLQISDTSEIEAIAKRIIESEPRAVEDYKKGKANALQFLAGKVMTETRGRANPALVQELLKKLLG